MKRALFMVLIVLALTSLACNISINVPRIQTGETKTIDINQPVPSGEVAKVTIGMGAGEFNLSPGASALVEGTIKYNVVGWDPTVSAEGDQVTIRQGEIKGIDGIPSNEVINRWDLKLSDAKPIDLVIEAGAYKGDIDLSDIRLRSLKISDGASDTRVTFNVPNPEPMERLEYTTGASQVKLIGLANANFDEMSFEGGAGSYTLDFTGTFSRDASVSIKAGVCNMRLVIPDGMRAIIRNEGAVTGVDTTGSWTVENNVYSTPGDGPTLTITVEMGVGNLELVRQSSAQ